MQFIFIDETGNSGLDLDNLEQPYHILFGVVIEHKLLPTIQNELLKIAKQYYPDIYDKSNFEFKEFDLYKGKSFNKNKNVDERIEITLKILNCLKKKVHLLVIMTIQYQKIF